MFRSIVAHKLTICMRYLISDIRYLHPRSMSSKPHWLKIPLPTSTTWLFLPNTRLPPRLMAHWHGSWWAFDHSTSQWKCVFSAEVDATHRIDLRSLCLLEDTRSSSQSNNSQKENAEDRILWTSVQLSSTYKLYLEPYLEGFFYNGHWWTHDDHRNTWDYIGHQFIVDVWSRHLLHPRQAASSSNRLATVVADER